MNEVAENTDVDQSMIDAHEDHAAMDDLRPLPRISIQAFCESDGLAQLINLDIAVPLFRSVGAYGSASFNHISNGTQFLGTVDMRPLDIRAHNKRVLFIQPGDISPNLVAGFEKNEAQGKISGAVVGGGGRAREPNRVAADFGTVAGAPGGLTSQLSLRLKC